MDKDSFGYGISCLIVLAAVLLCGAWLCLSCGIF